MIVVLGYFCHKEEYEKWDVIPRQVNWFAIAGVLIGAAVANLVPWGIASVNGMVIAAVCYLVGELVEWKKKKMTLRELPIGKTATIKSVGGEGALRQHFLDMGLIPQGDVTMVKYAPMGDPMELRIHSYELTLRLADAEKIEIENVRDVCPETSRQMGSRFRIRVWEKRENITIRKRKIRCRIRRY